MTRPGRPASLPRLRRPLAHLLALAVLVAPSAARGQGIALALLGGEASAGEDLEVVLAVDDPLGLVASVEVEVARPDGARSVAATPSPGGRWRARFDAGWLWASPAPVTLALTARARGARGGLLAELGGAPAVELEILDRARAAERRRFEALDAARSRAARDPSLGLDAHVGLEARAGSAAPARLVVGAAGAPSPTTAVLALVLVGPRAAPAGALAGSGPVTLGFEVAARSLARPLAAHPWATFADVFATLDLRLPGLDAGGGLRAGVLVRLGAEVWLEAAVSGGLVARALDASPAAVPIGGLRLGLRFSPEAPGADR